VKTNGRRRAIHEGVGSITTSEKQEIQPRNRARVREPRHDEPGTVFGDFLGTFFDRLRLIRTASFDPHEEQFFILFAALILFVPRVLSDPVVVFRCFNGERGKERHSRASRSLFLTPSAPQTTAQFKKLVKDCFLREDPRRFTEFFQTILCQGEIRCTQRKIGRVIGQVGPGYTFESRDPAKTITGRRGAGRLPYNIIPPANRMKSVLCMPPADPSQATYTYLAM